MSKKLLPRLVVVGYGGHGKDTVCEILEEKYGFTFKSSSKFCSEKFIFTTIKDKYGYNSEEDCHNDRRNHRGLWYNLIEEYCTPDLAKLGRNLFREYNIYCGARNKKELLALEDQGLYDYVIWVDRSEHLPAEDDSSMTITQDLCDYTIDNNGSLEELEKQVMEFLRVGLGTIS